MDGWYKIYYMYRPLNVNATYHSSVTLQLVSHFAQMCGFLEIPAEDLLEGKVESSTEVPRNTKLGTLATASKIDRKQTYHHDRDDKHNDAHQTHHKIQVLACLRFLLCLLLVGF